MTRLYKPLASATIFMPQNSSDWSKF